MAEGWNGANQAHWMIAGDKCKSCNKKGDVRIFHTGKRHKVVCRNCASKLSNRWHGCGCGG
jgi:hypothetical protein